MVMEDTAECIPAETHGRDRIRGGGEQRKLWKLFTGIASAEYFYIPVSLETSNTLLHVCSVFPDPGGPESRPWKSKTCVELKAAEKSCPKNAPECLQSKPTVLAFRTGFIHTISFSCGKGGSRGTAPEGLVGLNLPLPFYLIDLDKSWCAPGYREPFPTYKTRIHLPESNPIQTPTPV